MKLGVIGLLQSGRSTIFTALTGARGEGGEPKGSRKDQRIATVRVMDERVDLLTEIYKPKKTTRAQIEYLLPSEITADSSARSEDAVWNQVRVCDALIHVLRNFQAPGGMAPAFEDDYWRLDEEMILNDMAVVEKRIERIALDSKRGQKSDEVEYGMIRACKALLEDGQPIRVNPELALAPALRGFTFLSAKPQLIVVNNDDEDESSPLWKRNPEGMETMVVRGRLEMDIASMSSEEAQEFLIEYNIETSALDRVIKQSYNLLNLISFFTVLNDEVRAWTIKKGTPSLEAAGTVHTDMQRGFIRAEVLAFEHLREYGSFPEAKKAGVVHLEGKEYTVQDGDIINFRFNI